MTYRCNIPNLSSHRKWTKHDFKFDFFLWTCCRETILEMKLQMQLCTDGSQGSCNFLKFFTFTFVMKLFSVDDCSICLIFSVKNAKSIEKRKVSYRKSIELFPHLLNSESCEWNRFQVDSPLIGNDGEPNFYQLIDSWYHWGKLKNAHNFQKPTLFWSLLINCIQSEYLRMTGNTLELPEESRE